MGSDYIPDLDAIRETILELLGINNTLVQSGRKRVVFGVPVALGPLAWQVGNQLYWQHAATRKWFKSGRGFAKLTRRVEQVLAIMERDGEVERVTSSVGRSATPEMEASPR